MAKSRTKTVEVEIPELTDIAASEDKLADLNTLCTSIRTEQDHINEHTKNKEIYLNSLRNLADTIEDMPNRVLGTGYTGDNKPIGWDLRRTDRTIKTLNQDRLKVRLLALNIKIPCPPVVENDTGNLVVCSRCRGNGVLEGLNAVLALLEECSETKSYTGWSVYERKEVGS